MEGKKALIDENLFIEVLIAEATITRKMTKEEIDVYRAPFLRPESRYPIYMWPNELPVAGTPARNVEVVERISEWLRSSETPKLVQYASPGVMIPPKAADWMAKNYRNIETQFIGYGRVAIAAHDEGIEAIVNMSQISAREEAKSPLAHTHWVAEQVFDWAEIGASHIHPGFFAEDLYLFTAGSIPREGKINLPFGDGKHAPVSAEDIARVVVGILIDPQQHVGQHYVVTGSREMTLSEMADVFSTELGKPVEYVNIPVAAWKDALDENALMPPYLTTHLTAVAVDHQNGIFSAETDVVETIGGQPPESLTDFIRRNMDVFGEAVAMTT